MSAKKILVPVTLSDGSLSSVLVAARLARELLATMVLLHVTPVGQVVEEGEIMWQLRQLAERARLQVPVEFVVSEGRVADKIIEQADAMKADAIVMCTHGRAGWFRWLHQQTAREVLRRTCRPVWLASPGSKRHPVMLSLRQGPEPVRVHAQPAHIFGVSHALFAPLLALFRQVWPIS